jgi:hypothetical protein
MNPGTFEDWIEHLKATILIPIAWLLILLLGGCANLMQIRMPDENGKLRTVCEVKQSSVGSMSYDPTTGIVNVDTRDKSFLQKNIIPIVSGVVDKVSRTVRTEVK